jgi:hypothetical protein
MPEDTPTDDVFTDEPQLSVAEKQQLYDEYVADTATSERAYLNQDMLNILGLTFTDIYEPSIEGLFYVLNENEVYFTNNDSTETIKLLQTDEPITELVVDAYGKAAFYVSGGIAFRLHVASGIVDEFTYIGENPVFFKVYDNNSIIWRTYTGNLIPSTMDPEGMVNEYYDTYYNNLTGEAVSPPPVDYDFLFFQDAVNKPQNQANTMQALASVAPTWIINDKTLPIPGDVFQIGKHFTDLPSVPCNHAIDNCTCKNELIQHTWGIHCNCYTYKDGSIQCVGFARYIYNYLWDAAVGSNTPDGKTATASTTFADIPVGAIVRVPGRSGGEHQLIVVSKSGGDVTTLEANINGDCQIFSRTEAIGDAEDEWGLIEKWWYPTNDPAYCTTHTYTDNCDATCNNCGTTRTAPHASFLYTYVGTSPYGASSHHKFCLNCAQVIYEACGDFWFSFNLRLGDFHIRQCKGCKDSQQLDHRYINSCDARCEDCKQNTRSVTHNPGGEYTSVGLNHYQACTKGCGNNVYSSHVWKTTATCETDAVCRDCGGNGGYTKYGHTPSGDPITTPSHSQHWWICSTCQKQCNHTTHNYSYSLATCTKPAACVCGKTNNVYATHVYTGETCTKPATCVCGRTNGVYKPHVYTVPTCTKPATCVCGRTSGSLKPHTWSYIPTCIGSARCLVCGTVQIIGNGHSYNNATCTSPQRCTKCGGTTGGLAPHTWSYIPQCVGSARCLVCGTVQTIGNGHRWYYPETSGYPNNYCTVCGLRKTRMLLNGVMMWVEEGDPLFAQAMAQQALIA